MHKPRRRAAKPVAPKTTNRRWRWATGLAAAILFPAALAWYHYALVPESATLGELVQPGAAQGYNVLLVTLDTVRRDRLGCYGYERAETPTCDRLAAEGVLFGDAVSSVPLTLPSHATLLTGLYPPHHGVRDNGTYRLMPEHTTLATTLKAHGYDTAAFVACFVLDARFGLDQGFDVYDFQVTAEGYHPHWADFNERPANAVTDAALGWLGQRKASGSRAPFFMWVHYFDAHMPYNSPLGREKRFAGRGYDAEIAFADQNLGRLRAELERQGLWQRTLVVVTADHGESLGEHEEPTHGMLLYSGAVRVPLIMSCAALFHGPVRIANQLVGLVDVRPTIEDLLGVTPTQPADGQSLVRAQPDAGRAVYQETLAPLALAGWSPLYALHTRASKLIRAPEPEYYDLEADPGETKNLYIERPAPLRQMSRELDRMVEDGAATAGAQRQISDDELQRLASLGYVMAPTSESTAALADPKAMMDVYNKWLAAEELYTRGQYEAAATSAQEVVSACEGCAGARRVLAFSRLKLGQTAEAVALLRSGVQAKPDVYLIRSLAQVLIMTDELAQAAETLKLYEAVDPGDGRVLVLRGDIQGRQGNFAAATALYEAAAKLDEARVGIMARERIARLKEIQAGARPGATEEGSRATRNP